MPRAHRGLDYLIAITTKRRRAGADIPHYTSNLMDAISLVPEGWFWTCGLCELTGHVTIGPDYNGSHRERLFREFPEEKWHAGISVDLPPGGTIDRVCMAICSACLQAPEPLQPTVSQSST